MKLVEMATVEVEALAQNPEIVAVLPIASIEQHGPHLAVSTDSELVTFVADSVERELSDSIMLCPTLQFGSSHHHLGFPGTLSLSPDVYVQVLVDLVESLCKSGFRRVVILNGHAGNIVPAKHALNILSDRYDNERQTNIALATYWELAGPAFQGQRPMESPAVTHACEYETSMMLHVCPDWVHMERIAEPEYADSNQYISWQNDRPYRGIHMSKATHLLTADGANGVPRLATAEKGEYLIAEAVSAAVAFFEDFSAWPFHCDLRAAVHA